MRVIQRNLPRSLREVILKPFGDEHDGDQYADELYVESQIDYVMNAPNAYALLNGDISNVATKNGKSDVYSSKYTIDEQFERQVNRFRPLANAGKILGVTEGNHEGRVYLESGLSFSRAFVTALGIQDVYCAEGVYLILRAGEMNKKESKGSGKYRQVCYTVYMQHGKRSGRKEGGKINALMELENIVKADIYIHGHSHLGAIIPGKRLSVDVRNGCMVEEETLFVNLAASLNYGGYGERGEYKPLSMKSPVIYLCGTNKAFDADLGERNKWVKTA